MNNCNTCAHEAEPTTSATCEPCKYEFRRGTFSNWTPIKIMANIPSDPPPARASSPSLAALNLTSDSKARKAIPMALGLLDYFPAALAEVAKISAIGNEKHNPGQPLHHSRGNSMDHADCIIRHLVDRGGFGDDGCRHSANVAWRALALLQQELEDAGEAPLARGARL